VFRAPAGTRIAVANVLPDDYRELEAYGFDLRSFHGQQAAS